MSRFGETTYDYVGFQVDMDAMAVKGDSSNVVSWTTDPTELMNLLFKGTEGSGSGSYAAWCKDEEGSIRGVGPNCSLMKEEGERDLALCYYRGTRACIEDWREEVFESSRRFARILEYNLNLAAAYISKRTRVKIALVAVYDEMKKSLDPEREAYDAAKEAFDECIEDITDDCECKHCVWTITYAEPEDETDGDDPVEEADDDPVEEEPTDFDPLTPEFGEISTTSNLGVIPKVWGRYVVGGNIIWVGNVRSLIEDITYDNNVTGRITATKYATYADVTVGLCAGVVDDILRVWFEEVLLLSNVVDLSDIRGSASDYDVSALSPNPYDLSSLVGDRASVTLYKGTESQKVNSAIAAREGFGRVPAHRGLAYVHLANINISAMGGSFPEVRVEVATKVSDDTPVIESTNTAPYTGKRLTIEPRSGQVFVNTADSLHILSWDTLSGVWEAPFDDVNDALIPLESGFHMAVRPHIGSFQKYVVYDQNFASRITALGELIYSGELLSEKFAKTRQWFDPNTGKYYDLIVYTDENQHPCYGVYDYSTESYEVVSYLLSTYPATFQQGSEALVGVGLYGLSSGLHYDHYYLDGVTQTAFIVGRHRITDSAGSLEYTLTPGGNYDEISIPGTSLWGSETTGVSVEQVMHSAADNSILVLFDAAGRSVLSKLDADTLAVVWNTTLPSGTSPWVSTGFNGMLRYAMQRLVYLTDSGTLISINLADGTVSSLGDLVTRGAPDYAAGAAQCYDGRTNSITYITDSGTVARVFIEKLSPQRVSFTDIIDDIATMSHLLDKVDAGDVSSITLGGYAVTEPLSLRDFINSVADFYGVSVVNDGTLLRFVSRNDTVVVDTIDVDRDVIVSSERTSSVSPATLPDTVAVTFVTIDDAGMRQSIQTVTSRGDDVAASPIVLSYSLTVNDDPSSMRNFAEKALYAARGRSRSFSAALMPRLLRLTPGDSVIIRGENYTLGSTLVSTDNNSEISASVFRKDELAIGVGLNSVEIVGGVNKTTIGAGGLIRPVVFFVNALTNDDSARSYSGRQIVYTAVEAASDDIEPTRVNLRIRPHVATIPDRYGSAEAAETLDVSASELYSSAAHDKSAHYGYLIAAPKTYFDRPRPFSSDSSDELTITFAKTSTVELIGTMPNLSAPAYEVLESETANILIIDQEFIKFGSYEILDSNTVRFFNLFRGWRGTEPYLTHSVGKIIPDEESFSEASGDDGSSLPAAPNGVPGRAYLYTSDTIKPLSIVPSKTKRRAHARVFTSGAAPAGYRRLELSQMADAGSSRPWAVNDIRAYALDGDSSQIVLEVKRRHPAAFDGTAIGDITDVWESPEFFCEVTSSFAEPLDLRDNNEYFGVEASRVYASVSDIVESFVVDMDGEDSVRVMIAQIARDEDGERLFGHPLFYTITAGEYPNYTP